MTLGTDRVRASFNPSGDSMVDEIKRHAAELIDLTEELRNDNKSEVNRCCALAQTYIEIGAMWAVKAATTGK